MTDNPAGTPGVAPPPPGWLPAVRTVLDVIERAGLPAPYKITTGEIVFWLFGVLDARQALAHAERALSGALGVTFRQRVERGVCPVFVLEAFPEPGPAIVIKARAGDVAEEQVTGHEVTEVRDWVRLPAGARREPAVA